MEPLTITLLVLLILALGGCATMGIMLWRLNIYQGEFEQYIIDLHAIISDYGNFADEIFKMSIYYYDDTVHEFIDKTKMLRSDLNEFMQKYEDLQIYVLPEKEEVEEPKEVLGLVRPDIYQGTGKE